MGYTIKQLAVIYCCSTKTIHRKLDSVKSELKTKSQKRKRIYEASECKLLIQLLGFPPDNNYNRLLRDTHKDLF
jgi:transcriptional antiterminator